MAIQGLSRPPPHLHITPAHLAFSRKPKTQDPVELQENPWDNFIYRCYSKCWNQAV